MVGEAPRIDGVTEQYPTGQIIAAILVGVIALLVSGLLPILLGGLSEEGRLSTAGIGLAATAEALFMAIAMGLAGAALKPQKLRPIGIGASVALIAANFATLACRGDVPIIIVRGLSGIPEGLLCWIAIGMIARTGTPERWSGLLFTIMTITELAISAALSMWILPTYGINGGFAIFGVISVAGIVTALWLPSSYSPIPKPAGESGLPPARGWIALVGTLLYVSAASAVSIYTVPLAAQAGLSSKVAQTAISFSLAAQVLGAALATVLAGRLRYFGVLAVGVILYTVCFGILNFATSAWAFIAATCVAGGVTIFVIPFLMPMMIEVDPSLRTAMQSATVQLFGPALGPFLASQVVGPTDAHGALWLAVALLVSGLAVIGHLRMKMRTIA